MWWADKASQKLRWSWLGSRDRCSVGWWSGYNCPYTVFGQVDDSLAGCGNGRRKGNNLARRQELCANLRTDGIVLATKALSERSSRPKVVTNAALTEHRKASTQTQENFQMVTSSDWRCFNKLASLLRSTPSKMYLRADAFLPNQ